MVLLDLIGRRWTLRVMWALHTSQSQSLTFRALQDRCEAMSSSVLNRRLRDLRDAGLVAREAGGYVLTPMGSGLVTLLVPLDTWAQRWMAMSGAPPGAGDAETGGPDGAPAQSLRAMRNPDPGRGHARGESTGQRLA